MTIHLNYGYAKRRCPNRPRCLYCGKRRTWIAFTYFGAPVCGDCWDIKWRAEGGDGETDPPFNEIRNEQPGEWL